MDVTSLVALISGLSGTATGIVSLFIANKKQAEENKKTDSDISVDTTEIAGNMIKTAGEISEIYKESLADCRKEIDSIKISTATNVKILQQEIYGLRDTITAMEIRNKERGALITRLIKGIDILIKQLEECNVTPKWSPEKEDLDTLTIS
jgi:hypothetical protein